MGKKAIIYGLCLSLALSLAGCGGQPAQEPQQEPQEPQSVQQTKEVTPPATPTKTETKPIEEKQGDKTAEPPVEESQAMEGETGADREDGSPEGNMAEVELFTDCNETVYVINTDSVNIRSGPGTSHDKIGSLGWGQNVVRTGIGIAGSEADGWSKVELSDGGAGFISSNYLSTTKPSSGSKSTGTTTSKPASSSSSGSSSGSSGGGPEPFDYYDGYGSYEAYLDAARQMFPDMSEEELRSKFFDKAKVTIDEDAAHEWAQEGLLTGGS